MVTLFVEDTYVSTVNFPKVLKIFGPGNSYVSYAKELVSKDVAIDLPAGTKIPSALVFTVTAVLEALII